MKKVISTLLLFSFLIPSVAFGQLPSPDAEPDVGKSLSPLSKGQKAPFTGVLLSPAAAASVIVDIESFEEKMRIEVKNAIQKEQAECEKKLSDSSTRLTAEKKEIQAELDGKSRTVDSLNLEIKRLKDSQTSPGLWLGIGAASGLVATLLTVFVVSQVTK